MIKIIPLLIFAQAILCNYDITWNCGPCSSLSIGANCFSFQGGPFISYYQQSIDDMYTSCAASNLTFPTVFSFSCNSACKECSIRIVTSGVNVSVCAQDQNGQVMTDLLDLYYQSYKNSTKVSYNWCDSLNCKVPVPVPVPENSNIGLIIGVIGGVVFVVGAGAVGFLFWRKRSKRLKEAPVPEDRINEVQPVNDKWGPLHQQKKMHSEDHRRISQPRRESLNRSLNLTDQQRALLR